MTVLMKSYVFLLFIIRLYNNKNSHNRKKAQEINTLLCNLNLDFTNLKIESHTTHYRINNN